MRKFFTFLSFFMLVTSAANVHAASTINPEEFQKKVAEARAEFNSLSKKDKKMRLKEAKKLAKEYKKTKKAEGDGESKVLLAILAILLPPLAVYLHEDEINKRFWISVILTLLFWIPGVIYALIVIFS